MSYLLTYVQRAGLVLIPLIVGVLGILMVPISAEAVNATAPVIKIEVKHASSGSTTGQVNLNYQPATHVDSTCPAPTPDGTWGPNYCYKIITPQTFTTPNGYQVVIQDETGQKAQLQIQDFDSAPGSSPQDGMKLSGIKITPTVTSTWNADSSVNVVVTITATNTFDAVPNPVASKCDGRWLPWSISTAGYWEARDNAISATSPIGNIFELFGQGTFVTTPSSGAITGTCTFNGTVFNKLVDNSGQPKGIWNNSQDTISVDKAYNKTADRTANANACVDGNASESLLCFTLAATDSGSSSKKVSFSGKHTSPYPGTASSLPNGTVAGTTDQRFRCSNNRIDTVTVTPPKGANITYTNPKCIPVVTYTHRFTLVGPDITALTGSEGGGGVVCNEVGTADKLPQCEGTGKGKNLTAEQIMTKWHDAQIKKALASLGTNVPVGVKCTTLICSGALELQLRLTPTEPADLTFPFRFDGPLVSDKSVEVKANKTLSDVVTISDLITGRGKSKIVIQADYDNFPQSPDGSWTQVDNFQFTSANGSTNVNPLDPNADVRMIKINGVACGVVVFAIGENDVVHIDSHGHNSSAKPVTCNLQ